MHSGADSGVTGDGAAVGGLCRRSLSSVGGRCEGVVRSARATEIRPRIPFRYSSGWSFDLDPRVAIESRVIKSGAQIGDPTVTVMYLFVRG
jgi:hypothetical protein